MPLGSEFKETVVERVRRDPKFATAMMTEAATLLLGGEPDTARMLLRDLVNATVGFKALAVQTRIPDKSLQRMLGPTGNPTLENLTAVLITLQKNLGIQLKIKAVAA